MWCFHQVFKGKDITLTLDWNRVRVFDKEVGQMFVNLAKTSREAQVREEIKLSQIKTAVIVFVLIRLLCYIQYFPHYSQVKI